MEGTWEAQPYLYASGMDSASGKNQPTNHNVTRNPSRGQTRAGGPASHSSRFSSSSEHISLSPCQRWGSREPANPNSGAISRSGHSIGVGSHPDCRGKPEIQGRIVEGGQSSADGSSSWSLKRISHNARCTALGAARVCSLLAGVRIANGEVVVQQPVTS